MKQIRTRSTCVQLTSAIVRTNVFVLLLVNGECSKGCICSRVLLTDLTESFITCSTLDGKPKLIFCGFCRGGNREPDYAKEMSTLSLEDKPTRTSTTTTTTNGFERMNKTNEQFFSQKESF